MAQRSVPKFVSDRTIDRVLRGSPFISSDNIQATSSSNHDLDKMLGFEEHENAENVKTIEARHIGTSDKDRNENFTTQKSVSFHKTSYVSSSSSSSIASGSIEAIVTVNASEDNGNGTMASPELTYTPGKSRLDAASLARLKLKYGSNRSGSGGVDDEAASASSKPIRKESRVALSTISTNVNTVAIQQQMQMQVENEVANTVPKHQSPAISSVESSKDSPISEPASRIAPSPEPEIVDVRKNSNSRRANPVRFNENPVMGVSKTPIQIQTDVDEYSPIPTHSIQLAGRTPKIRYDVKLVDSEEKANSVVAAMNRQESLGRLWTADDFDALSSQNSPMLESSPSPVASTSDVTRTASYSPTENIEKAMTGDNYNSPAGLSTNLLLANSPKASRQFRDMAKDLNEVVSRRVTEGYVETADDAAECLLNLTDEEVEENRRWQEEEDETNRLLALEEAEKQRKQQDFENQCRMEEIERVRRAEEAAAMRRQAEEAKAQRQRIAQEEAVRRREIEKEEEMRRAEEIEIQRRVDESALMQRRLEEAEKQQKLLLEQVQQQQKQLQAQQEQAEMMNTASASSCGSEIIQTRSVSRSEASTATPYVSHFAQKSKYGGVIHLTKSPTELHESQANKLGVSTYRREGVQSNVQTTQESPEMFSTSAAWKIQSNRAVLNDSRVSPHNKIDPHHVNHQYTLDDSNATINMSLVGRSHSFHPLQQQLPQHNKFTESDDDVSQVSTGESFSTIQLGEIGHSTIAVSAFNRAPVMKSSHHMKTVPVSLGSLVSAPPQRASAVNSSTCSAAETDTSYTGVSLSHPHPRGKHFRNDSAPVSYAVPRMDTTKINSPLKMPHGSQPLSAYIASHQYKKVVDDLPAPPVVRRSRQVESSNVVPQTPGPVSDSYIVNKYLSTDDSNDCDKQLSSHVMGASRVPIDERYLDVCSEDYDDGSDDDSKELFRNIHDESTDSDNTFTFASKSTEVKTSAPETIKRAVAGVSVSTQVTPGLSMLSKMNVDTLKEVNFDVSDDSSVDEETEAKQRFPRSPYAKERLDDSEDFEFGLDELLAGSNNESCKKTTSSPYFSKSIHQLADTYSQQKKTHTSSSPDTLGSGPRRVIATSFFNDDESSVSSSEISGLELDSEKDAKAMTDQQMVSTRNAHEYDFESGFVEPVIGAPDVHAVVDMDESALLTTATTLSLDSIDNLSELIEDEMPRMVLSQRQRKADDCSDVKEIVIRGSVGVETTIVLPFTNKRDKMQDICVKAVQMRFDTFKSDPKSGLLRSPKLTPGGANTSTSSFNVQPSQFQMNPGADASIFVRFAPINVGVYSGVLKIRCGKKSFMLLLRGEATIETPRRTLGGQIEEECTPRTVQLNRSITFEGDAMKWADREETEIASDHAICQTKESRVVVSPVRTEQKKAHEVKLSCDPLLMKQKWMRKWLNRANERGMAVMAAVPAITTIARHNGVFPTQVIPPEDCITSASISVIPSSLRLLPQRVEENGKHGVQLVSTGILQGNLLVRNFSDETVEIGIATSSTALVIKSSHMVIGAYDAVSVFVEYDPVIPANATPGSPIDSDGAHVGYVMIRSSSGEEFVADIKMPPKSCLSPFNPELDQLKANNSLREYINHEQGPCEMSTHTITSRNTSLANDVTKPFEAKVETKDEAHSMIVTNSPPRSNNAMLNEISSPQDEGLLARKRERAQKMKEKRAEDKKEKATARGREILAKTKATKTTMKYQNDEAQNDEAHTTGQNEKATASTQHIPHYMHPIHHKGGVHKYHGVVKSDGYIVDLNDGEVIREEVASGTSVRSSSEDVAVEKEIHEGKRVEKEESQVEVNTPIPMTPSKKLFKRMLIDKYSPGTSAAVAGLIKISSAAAANTSATSVNNQPSIASVAKKSMTSPRVSLTPTKTAVSPLKVSLKKSVMRSPRRGTSTTPIRQVKSSAKKSAAKSGAATMLLRSIKKTPGTKYSCNAERIKERDEAVTNGVFFKKLFIEFGTVKVGSLTRQKIEVCNSTGKDIMVVVKDPSLPFVTLHNEVKVRANSFVRLPIRFVPVHRGHFEMDLVGKVNSTGDLIKIALVGDCF